MLRILYIAPEAFGQAMRLSPAGCRDQSSQPHGDPMINATVASRWISMGIIDDLGVATLFAMKASPLGARKHGFDKANIVWLVAVASISG